jgi:hypothetical protein
MSVAGAFVRLADSSWAVRTNAAGEFLLRDVPLETQVLLVSGEGFVTLRVPGLALQAGRRTDLGRVRLTPAGEGAEQLAEMVVNASELGGAFGAATLYALQAMIVAPSRYGLDVERGVVAATLTQSDLLALPQLGDDLYRAISHLPGLAADDMTARFWVRGAPHEQVLARLDGVDLLEPFHLKDTDGALSILDLETIARLNLFTGGFTAEYGDRLAGVLVMETDSHTRPQPRSTVGFSLTGVHAASRGQTKDGSGRWLMSARSGYPDIALKASGPQAGDEIRPRYHDVMGKWEWRVSPEQTLSFHALHAGDRMFFRDGDGPTLTSRYSSDYAWARWRGDFGGVTGEAVLAFTNVEWARDGAGFLTGGFPVGLHERRKLRTLALRQDWSVAASERAWWRGGVELKAGRANYDYRKARDWLVLRDGLFRTERSGTTARLDRDGLGAGAYLTARVQPWAGLTLEPGVRYDGNDHAHDAEVAPRCNAALQRGASTWRAAWGRHTQAQGLHELAVRDGDTGFRPAERAEHRVLSFEHRFAPAWSARIEAYERFVRRPRPHWDNVVSNRSALPELAGDRMRIEPVHQRAQGVEVIVESRGGRALTASASYAYARSQETLRSGFTFPRSRDQRHTVYLDATYTPNPRWQFAFAWQYHTGWPTTAYEYSLAPLAGGGAAAISTLGPINTLRLPAYQRLDWRAQRRFALRHGSLRVFLDVFNVFGRENIIDYAYDVRFAPGNRLEVRRKDGQTLFPRLPNVGATWDF